MYQITLSLPDETALALHLTPEQLAQQREHLTFAMSINT